MTKKFRSVSTFPRDRVDDVPFKMMKNSQISNLLSKTQVKKGDIDPITGDAISKNKDLTLRISNFKSLSITKIRTSAHRFFDSLTLQFTKDDTSAIVKLPIDDYMQLCSLKDKKEAYNQVKKDLALLMKINVSYQKECHPHNKKNRGSARWYEDFGAANICSHYLIQDGIIYFEFTRVFYEHLRSSPVMPIPQWIFKLEINYKPHAYYLARKLCEHHNMNYGKPNANVISVKTLSEACPNLPTKKEVGKRFSECIKNPFERDLDALEPYVQWEYCNSKGTPLTDDQLSKFDYAIFIERFVKFQINEYPTRVKPSLKAQRKQRKK